MIYSYWLILVALQLTTCAYSTNITESSPSSKRQIDGSNWMRDNISTLGKRTLKEICMPGSHDAGMYNFYSGTSMAHFCNVLTQSLPISGQLEYGSRYFDVRPHIVNGSHYITGHYVKLPMGRCIGGSGQSMESIVSDINEFIAHHKELIIVKLSHSLNLDRCDFFRMHEWEAVLRILDQTRNLYFNMYKNVRLDQLTLNNFTNSGTKGAVLYIVSDPKVKLWQRLGRGFFYESNLNLYDVYSKTHRLSKMMHDQIRKMKEESKKYFFILSWTLTQGVKKAFFCRMKLGKTIKQLAVLAHDSLPKIIPEITSTSFPNVLYVDDIKDTNIVSLAMDINNKLEV